MLFHLEKSPSPLCSFCKLHDKTLIHVFGSSDQVISLWIEIKLFFSKYIQLKCSPQIATFGLVKSNDKSFSIQYMILIIFELYGILTLWCFI